MTTEEVINDSVLSEEVSDKFVLTDRISKDNCFIYQNKDRHGQMLLIDKNICLPDYSSGYRYDFMYSAQYWSKYGILDRLTGPAYISNNKFLYFVDGKELTEEEFNRHPKVIEFENNAKFTEESNVDNVSNKFTYRNGKYHSYNDNPAYEYHLKVIDMLFWMKDGISHRLTGPAQIYSKTIKVEGKETYVQEDTYYIEGVKFTEEEFNNHPEVIKRKK
jgi:hypothetical protein